MMENGEDGVDASYIQTKDASSLLLHHNSNKHILARAQQEELDASGASTTSFDHSTDLEKSFREDLVGYRGMSSLSESRHMCSSSFSGTFIFSYLYPLMSVLRTLSAYSRTTRGSSGSL